MRGLRPALSHDGCQPLWIVYLKAIKSVGGAHVCVPAVGVKVPDHAVATWRLGTQATESHRHGSLLAGGYESGVCVIRRRGKVVD